MAARRFCISNETFQLQIHFFGNTLLKHANNDTERPRLLVELPPLPHFNQIAERLHNTPDCADSTLMTVDEIGIADNGAFCRFRPLFIPPVDRKGPRQPRQQICRAGVRVPQLTNTDRRFSISAQAFAAAISSGDEPVGSRRESLIRASGHDAVFGTERRLRTVEHDVGQWCSQLDTLHAFHMQSGINGRQTDVAPQPVLCRDIRFQFFTAAARMGSLSGPG